MEPGVVIGSRYRLVEPLASGGMGTVWRARHVELDVDVAVKLMSDALARTPSALARFQREAKAAAQLKSPHVVQVFDYGVDASRPYLAMELLEGEDLRHHLARVGAMPLDRAGKVLDGVAKALRLAHAAGIVHRDLKPANLFLQGSGDDEVVKILDFGIAKDLGPVTDGLRTSSSTVVGSPLYMSPEQVRGADLDHRTDVWSLAVIAFEMVTGRQPFDGASLGDVFARIIADDIPRASTVAPWLPASLDTFFERALARPVAKRFTSAPELAEAFRAAVAGAVSRELPPSKPEAALRTPIRVAIDAPTVDISAPELASIVPSAIQSVEAHTSGQPAAGLDEIELARTVATPHPALQATPSIPAGKGTGRGAFAVIGLGVLAAVGIGVYALRSGTDETAPLDATAESRTPTSSPAPSPSTSAASSPEMRVEPSPSAAIPSAAIPSAAAPSTTAPSSAPAPTASPARPPRSGPWPPPTGPAATPTPTTAIDPTYGVPVKKP